MEYNIEPKSGFDAVFSERTQFGIWDHQNQRLVCRYVRPIEASYKRVETKFPRLFNQMNHATTALNQLLASDVDAFTRYEIVSIKVAYTLEVSKPTEQRAHTLLKKQALSKLTKEEARALGLGA